MTRAIAAIFAAEYFDRLCTELELANAAKLSPLDVAIAALEAKQEAEERHGTRISATLDEEGNWHFA